MLGLVAACPRGPTAAPQPRPAGPWLPGQCPPRFLPVGRSSRLARKLSRRSSRSLGAASPVCVLSPGEHVSRGGSDPHRRVRVGLPDLLKSEEQSVSARPPTPGGVSGPRCCRPPTGAATSERTGGTRNPPGLQTSLPNQRISLFLKPFLAPLASSARAQPPVSMAAQAPRGRPTFPRRSLTTPHAGQVLPPPPHGSRRTRGSPRTPPLRQPDKPASETLPRLVHSVSPAARPVPVALLSRDSRGLTLTVCPSQLPLVSENPGRGSLCLGDDGAGAAGGPTVPRYTTAPTFMGLKRH